LLSSVLLPLLVLLLLLLLLLVLVLLVLVLVVLVRLPLKRAADYEYFSTTNIAAVRRFSAANRSVGPFGNL
jgi:hypothetical protein